MYKIISKKMLNDTVCQMLIDAPLVAKKAKAGQFIILRVNEDGERIPLTIAGVIDNNVKIIFQIVGETTMLLGDKKQDEYIQDFVGPLGKPTEIDNLNDVCIVAGGVGCAIALNVCESLKKENKKVTSIIGFRNKDLVILEEEFNKCSDELIIMSDDGSYGKKGNVTLPLDELLASGRKFDKVITIGPLIMMKYVVETCKKYNMPCDVSMNPIMIDGTGMCGGCRLSLNIDGKKVTKFACVDGPDFNGYEIDFDEAISRNNIYKDFEKTRREETCNLLNKE
ncbi:MAG: sulfide/dihydroorotate dehydrogenase-like FAD/NAD-binding protein [Erysipelotrichaceae bacterium]|nr:sulfide/dihydroorotate dehydrogenase-like FAD/NAD-binding protein [Erysipelotrichaceae bacterium]